MDRFVVTITVERDGEELFGRTHSQPYRYPLNTEIIEHLINATIEDYDNFHQDKVSD